MPDKKDYSAENIQVLEGLEGVRKCFDIVELKNKIKRKGDIFILSQELKIKPHSLSLAIEEARVLSFFPDIHKSKTNALSRLRTDGELIKFSEKYSVDKLKVRKLYETVRKWNLEIQKSPLMLLTQDEHNLIMGSLLGDASIRQRQRSSCFRVAHSVKQKDYINWKLAQLKSFNISEFAEKKRVINKREVHMIYLSTKTHPIFNFYRGLFYRNNKKVITSEILEQLSPMALAIWVYDDGSYDNKQGYIVLCTNAYSLEEHKLMKEYFNRKFGLDPTIGFRDGKYYYLRFKKSDSNKLINIIRPFIISSMKYKIGEKDD